MFELVELSLHIELSMKEFEEYPLRAYSFRIMATISNKTFCNSFKLLAYY